MQPSKETKTRNRIYKFLRWVDGSTRRFILAFIFLGLPLVIAFLLSPRFAAVWDDALRQVTEEGFDTEFDSRS
jgi:hypothetical protein